MKLPDRWLDYSAIGNVIPGTNIICFKVPLKQNYFLNNNIRSQRLTVEDVARAIPRLGLVINLTNTHKYYSLREWEHCGIECKWIKTEGRVIPKKELLIDFCKTIEEFNVRKSHKLVGVHCTHGLNRTGYFVCSYMTLCKQMSPFTAIANFESARGHTMERKNYIDKIKSYGEDEELKEEIRRYERIPDEPPVYKDDASPERRDRSSHRDVPRSYRDEPQERRNAPPFQRAAPFVRRDGPQVRRDVPSYQDEPQNRRDARPYHRAAPFVRRDAPSYRNEPPVRRDVPSYRDEPQDRRNAPIYRNEPRDASQNRRDAPRSSRYSWVATSSRNDFRS